MSPVTGPRELLRSCGDPGLHRIHLDVTSNPLKLRVIADQPIVTLVLPKRSPGKAEHTVGFPCGESLQRLHELRNLHSWSNENVNVIGHHDEAMQRVVARVSMVNSVDHYPRDLRPAKIQRASACVIKKSVHRKKRLPGGGRRGKAAIGRQTPIQPPCEKNGLAKPIIVRQAASMESGHERRV